MGYNTVYDAGGSGGSGASTAADITDATTPGRNLLKAVDVSAQRTLLGLGTAAIQSTTVFATAAQGDLADTSLQPADVKTINGTSLLGGG
jgi:hypothetical protein